MLHLKHFFNRSIIILILINLRLVAGPDIQNNESCYHALTNILNLYKRPITVLEIHTFRGDYSFRIANEYDSTCVMLEDNYSRKNWLLERCKNNKNLNNIILLRKKIRLEDLERLASCEHFDVVLAFNIIHPYEKEWERAANAVLNLGDNIIIEIPFRTSRRKRLKNYLTIRHGNIICEDSKHTKQQKKSKLFWFKNEKRRLERHHWLGKKGFSSDYIITSNFKEKRIYKKKENKTNCWVPGINLLTFKMLDGTWPAKNMITACIEQMRNVKHEDFMIWNMIIQGTQIIPIDYNIASKNPLDFDLCMSFVLGMIKQDSSARVIQWFKDNWPHFAAHQDRDIPLKFFDCE